MQIAAVLSCLGNDAKEKRAQIKSLHLQLFVKYVCSVIIWIEAIELKIWKAGHIRFNLNNGIYLVSTTCQAPM